MPLYISTKVYLKSPHSLTDLLPCLRLALFETGATYSKRIYIWSHTGLFSQSLFFFFDLSSEVIFLLFSRHLCGFFILTSSCCFIISLALCRCRRTELDVQKLWHISVSPLPQGQPLLLLNSTKRCVAIYVHACVCVCVDVSRREIDRVANRWTGRLVVCLSTFKTHQTSPFCDYTVYLQVWKKKKERKRNGREWASCYLRACAAWACGGSHMFLAVLSKPVCSPGGCHGNSQTAADFAPASSGGLWEQRGGLRVRNLSESLKKKKSFGEKPPNFLFFLMLKGLNSTGVWCFWRFQQTCFNSGFNKDLCSIFFFLLFVQAIKF